MWRDLLQPSHLIIVVAVLAILFGWKKLPDAARSVGRSMRIFKSEVSEMKNDGKEGRPSPAASDTVPGGVVPPQQAPQAAPQTPPAGTPQAQAPQYAPPQYADAPQYQPQPQPSQPQYQATPQYGEQPAPQAQPERHDSSNPAL